MSSTLNTVNLIGFVGTEPDIKNSNSGIGTHISIGGQEKFKNRDGTYTERTDWIKITSFGNTAKYVSQFINTGDLVVVEGKLKNNNYTDRNGKKHSEMYVQSNNISLLRKKGLSSEAPQAGYTTSSLIRKKISNNSIHHSHSFNSSNRTLLSQKMEEVTSSRPT